MQALRRGILTELQPLWSQHVGDYVTTLTASHDGAMLAVGTASGDVLGLESATGAPLFKCMAHPGGVLSASFSPRSRVLATAGQDGYARLFGGSGQLQAEVSGGAAWVEQLAWSPDGARFATTSGRAARVWTRDGLPVFETEPGASTLTGIAWNREGTQLATSCYGGVRLVDGRRGKTLKHLAWHASLISLAWSPDDAVIACGTQEASVHFWRLATGKSSEISGFVSKPRALSWDAASNLLATAGAPTISVWPFDENGPEKREPMLLAAHQALCTVLAFHPQRSRLASGGDDGNVFVWDLRSASSPVGVARLQETITTLAWVPGGRLLVASDASGLVQARLAPT